MLPCILDHSDTSERVQDLGRDGVPLVVRSGAEVDAAHLPREARATPDEARTTPDSPSP